MASKTTTTRVKTSSTEAASSDHVILYYYQMGELSFRIPRKRHADFGKDEKRGAHRDIESIDLHFGRNVVTTEQWAAMQRHAPELVEKLCDANVLVPHVARQDRACEQRIKSAVESLRTRKNPIGFHETISAWTESTAPTHDNAAPSLRDVQLDELPDGVSREDFGRELTSITDADLLQG